jgi:hypothetical protein
MDFLGHFSYFSPLTVPGCTYLYSHDILGCIFTRSDQASSSVKDAEASYDGISLK